MISYITGYIRRIRLTLSDLANDESGSATLEYCAAGGALSGMIFWAFEVLRETQKAALERALATVG